MLGMIFQTWQFIVVSLAGWLNRHQQEIAEYLREENRVLREQLKGSRCGNTPQYAGLQKLYEEHRDDGLVVLGFPANDFGHQDPGTNAEIQTFFERKYHVTFPMFAKIHVKGPDKHPLYVYLTDKTLHPELGGEVKWNFAKFLIGRDGKVVARFSPRTQPSDPKVRQAIAAALANG